MNDYGTIPANFTTGDTEEGHTLECYFIVWGSTYQIGAEAFERIEREALIGFENEDVRALVDHKSELVLGRTGAGTLCLTVDDYGLKGVIKINPADQDAVNLYERVKRGDVNQCSVGFIPNQMDRVYNDDGKSITQIIRSMTLYEVSIVTFPANEATLAVARSAKLSAERWRQQQKNRLKGG